MIKGIIGKPGAGKSYVTMSIIETEIATTKRVVITNVSYKLGEFAEYLQSKYGDTFDVGQRLVSIESSQVRKFWELRRDAIGLDGKKIGGCVFVLDECHRNFNARLWAENKDKGKDCLDYLSAHRHFGDDVFWISQNTHFLDKQFIRTTQDFTMLRNMGKEKWGWFRGPGRFSASVYLSPPDSHLVAATHSYRFKLDMEGLANCYHTDALDAQPGQGPADKQQKVRGLPIWMFPVGLVVIATLVLVGFRALGSGVRSVATSVVTASAPAASRTNLSGGMLGQGSTNQSGSAGNVERSVGTNVVRMTGLVVYGGRFTAYLSDGRRIHQGDALVGFISEDAIVYDGVRYSSH